MKFLIGCLIIMGCAWAVEADLDTNEVRRLPAVLVTGQPEMSLIQETPASLTQWQRDDLAMTGIESVQETAFRAPNLSLSRSVSRSYGDIYAVRGVGNTQFFSSPGMAVYMDDVPMGTVMAIPTDLLDVERIECWRGPQGTVFGQNSEAGALNIISRRPTNHMEAFASARYSTFNEQAYCAGVMGPLVQNKLYGTLAGSFSHLDGFLDNPTLGTHPDHREGWNGRLSLLWTPAAEWEIGCALSGDQYHDGARIAPLFGAPDQAPAQTDPAVDSDSNTESLRIVRVSGDVRFLSITARRDYHLDPVFLDFRDPAYAVLPNTVNIRQDYERWTEELRAESLDDDAPWRWSARFFFATARQDGNDVRTYYVPLPFPRTTQFTLDEDNYALLGQITYAGLDKLAITLGGRLDYTVRGIDRVQTFTAPLQAERGMFNAVPKLTISCQFTTNLLAYASTGLGFKPGGYSAYMDPPQSPAFDTERNWASEIGLKSSWLDNKLLANLALFYNNLHDYQVELMDVAGNLAVYNADRVTTCGAELELTAKPIAGLELSGMFGYTYAVFDEFTSPVSGADLAGRHPPYVPEFTAAVSAQYKSQAGFLGRIEFQMAGRTSFDEANTGLFTEPAYGLLHARIGYETAHWGIYLFGRNLTDTDYLARKVIAPPSVVMGDPRTVGVMASVRY